MSKFKKFWPFGFAAIFASALTACGGGGSSPAPPPMTPAPSGLSYSPPASFTRGTAITQLTPTVMGTVSSYAVAPALPDGLALNAGSGIISGTPTEITTTANYVITASNAGASTTTTLSLTVNDILPDVGYSAATQIFTTGVPVTLTPTNGGGLATQWSVDRPLPEGLTLNDSSGVISGSPTAISAANDYVISARNSGGTDTFSLRLAVQSGVLLDLGHAAAIQELRFDGSRIASLDAEGHIALWNAQTGAEIVSTDTACNNDCGERMALAGATVVFRQPTGLDVRTSTDGAAISTIALPQSPQIWWMLAADGSYICAGSSTGLTAWSPNGAILFSRSGNYSASKQFAAAGELRIAGGPAGVSVIEKIGVPGGTTTLTPAFQGQFHSWFLDGERFLTNIGNTVWVYSREAVQQDLVALSSTNELSGQGEWFWTKDSSLVNIFKVGSSAMPSASYSVSATTETIASGSVLGLISGSKSLSVVDFASGAPVKTDYTYADENVSAFGARNASDWVVGDSLGVMLGDLSGPGAPLRYSIGKVLSIAGNDSRIALGLAAGNILYFNAATRLPQGEIASSCTAPLVMSADGTKLAVGPTMFGCSPDDPMRVYELPSDSVLAEWTFPAPRRGYTTGRCRSQAPSSGKSPATVPAKTLRARYSVSMACRSGPTPLHLPISTRCPY